MTHNLKSLSLESEFGRRQFLTHMSKVAAAGLWLGHPAGLFAGDKHEGWTVGQIMDLFMNEVPGGPIMTTVDTLKAGSRETIVTGIVTTMFATIDVIKKAIALNANFIIAHEPTFYNHTDNVDKLQDDDVYRYKADLLKKHNIAVWRNHDHIHRHMPDGVKMGVASLFGWERYFDPKKDGIVTIPTISLKDLLQHVKQKMHIPSLRYIGDPAQSCRKILFNPGYNDGAWLIPAIQKEKPDVVMAGEMREWEGPEYIRDARASGQSISLIMLGHADSEEPGSQYMIGWLNERIPGLKGTEVPAGNPFTTA